MAASNIVRKMEAKGTRFLLKGDTFPERLKYALVAARRSRPLAIHLWLAYLFHLVPEPLARYVVPYCRFTLGSYRFIARRVDWPVVEEVALRGEYDFVEIVLEGKKSPVVLDLGANIGMFSLRVFRACPSAMVYAVEASSKAFQILSRNRNLNPGLSWRVCHGAVWREDGSVRFRNAPLNSGTGSVGEDGDERVPAVSLASLLNAQGKRPVDLLKIDIEGGEEALLCGNAGLLGCVDAVLIEIHPARCNARRVREALVQAFEFIHEVFGRYETRERVSSTPLILASRIAYNLPRWEI